MIWLPFWSKPLKGFRKSLLRSIKIGESEIGVTALGILLEGFLVISLGFRHLSHTGIDRTEQLVIRRLLLLIGDRTDLLNRFLRLLYLDIKPTQLVKSAEGVGLELQSAEEILLGHRTQPLWSPDHLD